MSLCAEDFPESDLSARIDKLEQDVQTLEAREATTAEIEDAAENAKIEKVVESYLKQEQERKASSRPTVSVFGRLHIDGIFFPEASRGIDYLENPGSGSEVQDRILFRRIRLGTQGNISPTGVYRLDMDFTSPNSPSMRDMYLGFNDLPIFQTVLIGNQKRPVGLDAWNSSTNAFFLERPLAVNALNPNIRRIGVQSYGYSQSESLNWQAGIFESSDVQAVGTYVDDHLQYCYVGRISGTPWYDETSGGRGYLHLGISDMYVQTDPSFNASSSPQNFARFRTRPELQTSSNWLDTGNLIGAEGYDVLGLEMVVNVGSLQVTGEFLDAWVDRQSDPDLFFHGGYVQVAYFLTGEYAPWDRQAGRVGRIQPLEDFFLVDRYNGGIAQGWGAWQVAARLSYLDLSDEEVHGGQQENLALALNWYWTSHSKVIMNLIHGSINDHYSSGGYTGGDFTALGIRFMMDY
ncbi:OprO/OprP family phosphate-selective porin [Bremerella cremea]|uniref:OprO/OprP family phosphate-selective porin n=1 Tax=Bremerella cremea TaxID=1031537 RepID=UPI0031E65273